MDSHIGCDQPVRSKAIAVACLFCVLAAILEAGLTGTHASEYLGSLAQPPRSPPLWAWYGIGAGYYGTCFLVLYRVICHGQGRTLRTAALVLVAAMMAMNAGWNWAFFRAQDPFLSLLLLLPYDALVGVLLVIVARVDRVGLRAMLPYAAYLVYANYWSHGVWRLNS